MIKLSVNRWIGSAQFAVEVGKRGRLKLIHGSNHGARMGFDTLAHVASGILLQPTLNQKPGLVLLFEALAPRNRIAEHQQVQRTIDLSRGAWLSCLCSCEGTKQEQRRDRGDRETFCKGNLGLHAENEQIVTQRSFSRLPRSRRCSCFV